MVHPQCLKERVRERGKALAGCIADDTGKQRDGAVGIFENEVGRVALVFPLQIADQFVIEVRVGHQGHDAVVDVAWNAGVMRQDRVQCDRCPGAKTKRGLDGEVWNKARQGIVQRQSSLLRQLHHHGAREDLRHRSDAVRCAGVRQNAGAGVGIAETFHPDHPLIVYQSDGKPTACAALSQLLLDRRAHPGDGVGVADG